MSKFKDCLASADSLRNYDVIIDGEIIGTAHTLTILDKAEIEKNSITKTISDGNMNIDISTNKNMIWTVLKALDSWVLDVPISIDVISKHPQTPAVYQAILEHEQMVAETVAGNEKN